MHPRLDNTDRLGVWTDADLLFGKETKATRATTSLQYRGARNIAMYFDIALTGCLAMSSNSTYPQMALSCILEGTNTRVLPWSKFVKLIALSLWNRI